MMEGQPWVHPDSVGIDKLHTLKVIAVDLASGAILWERVAYEGTVFDHRHRRSSYAAPTMVTDGTTVVAYFGPEGLYGYDLDGNLKWKADVGKFPLLGMGTGTSPVLFENLVIIQRDENEGKQSLLFAFDITTGKEAWRTPRAVEASWSTPVLVKAYGRTELVTNGNQFIISYDPKTGKELWRSKGVESNAIHTPARRSRAGHPHRRVPGQEGHRHPAGRVGRHHRHRSHRVAIRPRHWIRDLADSLWRLRLPGQRQGHHQLPRRQDRRGEVRGRAACPSRRRSWRRRSPTTASCC